MPATARLLSQPLDAVLAGQMPNMGGTECGSLMRQKGFTGTIVGMTGDPVGSEDRDRFVQEGGLTMCLDKTTDGMREVEECIKDILEIKRRAGLLHRQQPSMPSRSTGTADRVDGRMSVTSI